MISKEPGLEEASLHAYQNDMVIHAELRQPGQSIRFGDLLELLCDYPETEDYGGIGIGTLDGRLTTVTRLAVIGRIPDTDQFEYARVEDCKGLLTDSITIGRSWRSPLGHTAVVGGIVVPDLAIKPGLAPYTVHPAVLKSPSLIGQDRINKFYELMEAGYSTQKLRRVFPR